MVNTEGSNEKENETKNGKNNNQKNHDVGNDSNGNASMYVNVDTTKGQQVLSPILLDGITTTQEGETQTLDGCKSKKNEMSMINGNKQGVECNTNTSSSLEKEITGHKVTNAHSVRHEQPPLSAKVKKAVQINEAVNDSSNSNDTQTKVSPYKNIRAPNSYKLPPPIPSSLDVTSISRCEQQQSKELNYSKKNTPRKKQHKEKLPESPLAATIPGYAYSKAPMTRSMANDLTSTMVDQ